MFMILATFQFFSHLYILYSSDLTFPALLIYDFRFSCTQSAWDRTNARKNLEQRTAAVPLRKSLKQQFSAFGVRTTHRPARCFMESDKNMQMYVKLFIWVMNSISL